MGSFELHCDSPYCAGYRPGYLRHNGLSLAEMTPEMREQQTHDLHAGTDEHKKRAVRKVKPVPVPAAVRRGVTRGELRELGFLE